MPLGSVAVESVDAKGERGRAAAKSSEARGWRI